jgi:hypothetical protein
MSSQTKLIKDILSIYDTILETKEVDETVDSLRTTLNVLGYDEKGSELTSGGNINDKIANITSNILKKYKETNPNVMVTVTSGNDNFHQKLNRKSKHTEGNAIDVTISPYNKKNASDFIKILNDTRNSDYKFSYIDEYTNPSGAATGGHFHLQYNTSPVDSSKNSTDNTKSTDDTISTSSSEDIQPDPLVMNMASSLTKMLGLTEEKVYGSFGDRPQTRYGSIVLPKENNSKIKSPVSGIIILGRNNRDCKNKVIIKHEIDDNVYYLEYCGISNPSVRNNSKISKGDVIGTTDTDVRLSLYNSSEEKESLDTNKEYRGKKTSKRTVSDDNETVISKLLQLPFKPFKNVRDKEGNLIQKRWGSPTEREQPVDWINRLSPTYNKKLKEDINRIKGLLK